MSRLQFTIDVGPTGETYAALIRAATRWCSTALLVVRKRLGLSEAGMTLLRQLEPHVVARRNSASWPGTTLLDETADVYTFQLNSTVVLLLGTATSALYGWQQPELPEDLCLLRDGDDPWLVTIAHEYDGYVLLEPGELEALRQDLPNFAVLLREDANYDT